MEEFQRFTIMKNRWNFTFLRLELIREGNGRKKTKIIKQHSSSLNNIVRDEVEGEIAFLEFVPRADCLGVTLRYSARDDYSPSTAVFIVPTTRDLGSMEFREQISLIRGSPLLCGDLADRTSIKPSHIQHTMEHNANAQGLLPSSPPIDRHHRSSF